jgi:site-specific DNA-methyltransferase (adenine-specific)
MTSHDGPAPGADDDEVTPRGRIVFGDNLPVLRGLPSGSVDLAYLDPPFNTGQRRTLRSIAVERESSAAGGHAGEPGTRQGFGGTAYRSVTRSVMSYPDGFDDYLAFLGPRLREVHRALAPTGSLYVHLDSREVHYVKVFLDGLFGRECFLNEVVWSYDFGGRSTRRWPRKHDTILVYVREPDGYWFDLEAAGRVPYLAPGLAGPTKAARGKLLTDSWWHTIVPTSGRERTGYPTQKPLAILRRIVAASSPRGALVLDPFAGSGTTGAAAMELDRRFIMVDDNPEAIRVMIARLGGPGVEVEGWPAA